jgi:hypothetical protein
MKWSENDSVMASQEYILQESKNDETKLLNSNFLTVNKKLLKFMGTYFNFYCVFFLRFYPSFLCIPHIRYDSPLQLQQDDNKKYNKNGHRGECTTVEPCKNEVE